MAKDFTISPAMERRLRDRYFRHRDLGLEHDRAIARAANDTGGYIQRLKAGRYRQHNAHAVEQAAVLERIAAAMRAEFDCCGEQRPDIASAIPLSPFPSDG
tara:strand:- start:138 stop:440 length:303 start_codon:yes stop_codon:yes gene_type:complete